MQAIFLVRFKIAFLTVDIVPLDEWSERQVRVCGYEATWHVFGQFIATSAEVTPNGSLVRKSYPKGP